MKRFYATFLVLFLAIFHSCSEDMQPQEIETSEDEAMTPVEDPIDNTDTTSGDTNEPLTTNLRTYIFGHSLIVHDPPAIATPSNETTVPHWMAELATAADFEFAVSGQYGFLPQHANLPPIAQWGFDRAAGAWDSDTESFSDANFNSILLTAGNFVQYQPATTPYDGDNPTNTSPLDATIEIVDWVEEQEPGMAIYIYENWPDMASFLSNGVPASAMEFENYNDYTLGEFHDWWIAYHEAVQEARPDLNVKMIPVGPVISKLLTETELINIPFSELYEDDAPHGRPTIYFLASLVTYMAMYGTEPPSDFEIPETVHALVSDNYGTTVNFIWNELEAFNDAAGNSLVFD